MDCGEIETFQPPEPIRTLRNLHLFHLRVATLRPPIACLILRPRIMTGRPARGQIRQSQRSGMTTRAAFLLGLDVGDNAGLDGRTQILWTSFPRRLISWLQWHHDMYVVVQTQRHFRQFVTNADGFNIRDVVSASFIGHKYSVLTSGYFEFRFLNLVPNGLVDAAWIARAHIAQFAKVLHISPLYRSSGAQPSED